MAETCSIGPTNQGNFRETITKVNGTTAVEPIETPSSHDMQIYGIVITILLCFIVFGGAKMINTCVPHSRFILSVLHIHWDIFCPQRLSCKPCYLNDILLSGHIPPELGKLTDLFDLNVHGNKLNGSIPPAFQKLESMTYLNLSSNNIQSPILIELSRIGNLDTLDLSNNKIIGSIPYPLGDLEHLLKLNLSRHHLTGFIPAEFGNLRSVMEMDLSSNRLSGMIPQELSQLQNMFLLRLEHNDLSGDVISLIKCLSLNVINVSYNNLAGDIPSSNNFSQKVSITQRRLCDI